MTVTVAPVRDGGGAGADRPVPGSGTFVDQLVARLHAQYGVDAGLLRSLADDVLAGFADAHVQAFVPILVEKRLTAICRNSAS